MKKFYPVIHVHSLKQTIHNIEIAKNNGADGTFLINHGIVNDSVFDKIIDTCVYFYQNNSFRIGVNFLNAQTNANALSKVFHYLGCEMCWSDNAGADNVYSHDVLSANDAFVKVSKIFPENHIDFFGGVHFKYQPKPSLSISNSIKLALEHNIIPTLSGLGTGIAADLLHIEDAYTNSITNKTAPNLAIASGISIENVDEYLPYIEYFLVASSIIDKSNNEELFDESKLKTLCEKIHAYV